MMKMFKKNEKEDEKDFSINIIEDNNYDIYKQLKEWKDLTCEENKNTEKISMKIYKLKYWWMKFIPNFILNKIVPYFNFKNCRMEKIEFKDNDIIGLNTVPIRFSIIFDKQEKG